MSVLKVKKDSVWEEVGGISGHTHTTTDITNFPSSLPADGGNADTVDGKHASDFAAATDMTIAQSDISDLQTKVGDVAVSAQISAAIEEKVSLPKDTEGNIIAGTVGWYAVSDGAGGITWVESAPSGGGETTTTALFGILST